MSAVILKRVSRPRSAMFAVIAADTHRGAVVVACKTAAAADEYRLGVAAAGGNLANLTIDLGRRAL